MNSWSLPAHLDMVSGWSAKCSDPTDPAGVSWRYFVQAGAQPDCADAANMICPPRWQSHQAPDFWNPLPGFSDVQQDGQLHDVTSPANYFLARQGSLPSVSWVVPNGRNSEHPPRRSRTVRHG